MNKGKIIQIMGPVVDVAFPDELPAIKEALEVQLDGKRLVMEVSQHIGNNCVRCIMLATSDGLCKDMEVVATGSSISVPVGQKTLGRLFNVVGDTLDGLEDDALYADLPASVLRDRYALQVTDITQLTTTIAEVEQVKGVVKVSAALDVANGFVTVRNVAVGVTVILLSVLLVVSFFIISNAIKMAMARREEEIAIMKMVGATNAFVRWPFVVEGVVLGIASAIVASALQWGIYSLITQAVNHYSHIRLVSILPYQTLALPVSCVYLGIGLLVGVCGSLITIRKFLRV